MIATLKQGSTQKLLDELLEKFFRKKKARGVNTAQYCGVLKLKDDAVTMQRKLRDEWR